MTEPSSPNPACPPLEKPLLAPWVSLTPEPTLFYTDARGKLVALALDGVSLARLGLSTAETQAAQARTVLCPREGA